MEVENERRGRGENIINHALTRGHSQQGRWRDGWTEGEMGAGEEE